MVSCLEQLTVKCAEKIVSMQVITSALRNMMATMGPAVEKVNNTVAQRTTIFVLQMPLLILKH